MERMERLAIAPRCTTPFQNGPALCKLCRLRTETEGTVGCSRMVARSPAMQRILAQAAAMARASAPVVVLGETGTGKEVMARALHASSPRAPHPFVAVNCGAIPAELLESELFGHARGAFSGAIRDKPGLFEDADRGTLLLDEVAELPQPPQVKLLRVLQDGEVRRVGESRTKRVDVRVIAATHRDLAALVGRELFREDLYYRLRVFSITLPPLRERREDILPLARHFLNLEGGARRSFTAAAQRALLAHTWPGNIRELSNAVRHGAALAGEGDLGREHFPEEVRSGRPGASGASRALRTLAEVQREHIQAVLAACGGNHSNAARVLGIARNTLWRKLQE